jgi:DNA sulfur modification protein DndE
MKDIPTDAVGFNMYYGGDAPIPDEDSKGDSSSRVPAPVGEGTPRFQKILLKNIFCRGAARAVLLEGLPEMPIQDIEMDNVRISARTGLECVDAHRIRLKDLAITPAAGPVLSLKDSRNVTIEKVACPDAAEVFLKLDGERTGSVRLLNTDSAKARKAIELGPKVPADAIVRP